MRHLVTLAMLIALMTVGGCGGADPAAPAGSVATRDEDPDPTVEVGTGLGDQAPDFTLQTADGGSVTLGDLRGGPVLVYFWASWCPYCTVQSPRVEDFHRRYGDGLTVLGINLNDPALVVEAYVAQHGLTFPVLFGTDGVVSSYLVSGIPKALVLDAAGLVVFNGHPGSLDDAFFESLQTRGADGPAGSPPSRSGASRHFTSTMRLLAVPAAVVTR
jgi:peroxiredoxin